jgi:hypothetical protein
MGAVDGCHHRVDQADRMIDPAASQLDDITPRLAASSAEASAIPTLETLFGTLIAARGPQGGSAR